MLIRSGQSAQSRAVDGANFYGTTEGKQQLADWQELGQGNQASLNEVMANKDPLEDSGEVATGWLDGIYNNQPTRTNRRFAKTYKYNKQSGAVEQVR